MPNWCFNRLQITGPGKDLGEFVNRVRGGDPDPEAGEPVLLDFAQHVPRPAGLAELIAENRNESGHLSGEVAFQVFDWYREIWGTKWNAAYPSLEGSASEGSVTFSFQTAWTPPDAWLGAASAQHPELRFEHEFTEELAHFAGRGVWCSGKLVESEELNPFSIEWIEYQELEE